MTHLCGKDHPEVETRRTSLANSTYSLRRFHFNIRGQSGLGSAPQRPQYNNMRNQWVIWLLIAGVAYVSGNECDNETASACYSDLVHYESLSFPLYGEDERKLDETCMNINTSFDCILNYSRSCGDKPECGTDCKELARDSITFSKNTGLINLATELCKEDSKLREIYLENYKCLESNVEAYSACHNDSQMSLEYLDSVVGVEAIPLRCCYFSWYHDCFVNVTRDNCAENATFFVSVAMHKLVGNISDYLCKNLQISCEKPPFPPSGEDNDYGMDKDKPDISDNEVDVGKPNETNKGVKSSGIATVRITNHAVVVLMLSYCFVLLSKMLL